MSNIQYFMPMFDRLEPRTQWQGGRVTDVDVLTLVDAAQMATRHAGEQITIGDILRAAGRGEVTLRAIVHRTAKVQKHDGGVYCNGGQENENTVPAGAIATLPLSACQHLAATGRASWRTFDGFELLEGVLHRYTKGLLVSGQPDFETVTNDCRITGYSVHALADAFKQVDDTQPQGPRQAAPEVEVPEWEPMAQKRAIEIIERQRKLDLYPPQLDIADEIAREFRAAGVVGNGRKPLKGTYIKRHALKGISSEQCKQLSTTTTRGK